MLDQALERQLEVLQRRADFGDFAEVETLVAQLKAGYGDTPGLNEHLAAQSRLAYEHRFEENLLELRCIYNLEGFAIRLLAEEVRLCASRLGREEPEELKRIERDAYQIAAEHYATTVRRESSRQLQVRLASFARYFARLAGPFCALEIDAALAEG